MKFFILKCFIYFSSNNYNKGCLMLTMRSLTKDEIIINFFWRRRSRAMLSEIHKPTVKICSQTESPRFFLPDHLGFFRKEDSFVRAPSHKTYGALTSLKWGFQRGLSSQEYPEVWSNWGQLHFILFPVWRSLDEEVQIGRRTWNRRGNLIICGADHRVGTL